MTRNVEDDAAYQRLKSKLWQPPVGQVIPESAIHDVRNPWSPENEKNAFQALAASVGAKG